MNSLLLLFIILLLGLILCSVLGGKNCLNEGFDNHITTSSGVSGDTSSIAIGPQGNLYTVSNSHKSKKMSLDDMHKYSFNGKNGGRAKIIKKNGSYQIEVRDSNGNTSYYTYNSPTATNSSNDSIQSMTFYGPYSGKAQVVMDMNGKYIIRISYPNGNSEEYTTNKQKNNSHNSYNTHSVDSTMNQGGMHPRKSYYSDYHSSNSNMGSMMGGNMSSNYNYSNSLPSGVPRRMIPPGNEDLYILKSEVVPPVCPACPQSASCPREEKCPPCPACARCPEPSFECKKVPNYNAINNEYLPQPIVNDFSRF